MLQKGYIFEELTKKEIIESAIFISFPLHFKLIKQ